MNDRLPHFVAERSWSEAPPGLPSEAEERVFTTSPKRLWWPRFLRPGGSVVAGLLLLVGGLLLAAADSVAPYGPEERHPDFLLAPPQPVYLLRDGRLTRPYVVMSRVSGGGSKEAMEARPVRFFCTGGAYSLLGLIRAERRLICPPEGGTLFLLGTDSRGRDVASRLLHAGRVSLAAAVAAVAVSLLLGAVLGGLAGRMGGLVRVAARGLAGFVRWVPALAVLALAAALRPDGWGAMGSVAGLALLLGLFHWSRPAAALGQGPLRMTAVAVLVLPSVLIAETALSFIGVGLPDTLPSWGVMLAETGAVDALASQPWLVMPAAAVVGTVVALRVLGEGLRQAGEPMTGEPMAGEHEDAPAFRRSRLVKMP